MKKYLAIFSLFAILFVSSCNSTSETENPETREVASTDTYQCPMDCEDGKTYTKEGKCSVCKMDLAAVKEE